MTRQMLNIPALLAALICIGIDRDLHRQHPGGLKIRAFSGPAVPGLSPSLQRRQHLSDAVFVPFLRRQLERPAIAPDGAGRIPLQRERFAETVVSIG